MGEREQALDLFERGYAEFVLEPFAATAEYSPKVFPDQPRAGPFAANLGGFLSALLYGLTGITLGPGDPLTWCQKSPSLPAGWRGIEADRIWVRGAPLASARVTETSARGSTSSRIDGPQTEPTATGASVACACDPRSDLLCCVSLLR